MPLHLAHHKSYHPYSAKNIEKVRRDEEQAALEDAQKAGRTLQADSESRLAALRAQAKKKRNVVKDAERALDRQLTGAAPVVRPEDERGLALRPDGPVASTSKTQISSIQGADGHINFFQIDQQPGTSRGGNAEYAADKKREQEKWDAMVTMSLGGPKKDLKPWYEDRDLKRVDELERTQEQNVEVAYKDGESKRMSDPLSLMSAYLRRRDDVIADNERRLRDPYGATPTPRRSQPVEPKLLRPSRRERERQRVLDEARAEAIEADSFRPAPPPLPLAIEGAMAAPALKSREAVADEARTRETSERDRAAALIRAKRASSTASTPRSEVGYSEGFNREAARDAKRARRDDWGRDRPSWAR